MPSKRTEFKIDSVLFSSPRIREPIELRLNVTDIDIYESLDKPYLTGEIVFVDSNNFIENADILPSTTCELLAPPVNVTPPLVAVPPTVKFNLS